MKPLSMPKPCAIKSPLGSWPLGVSWSTSPGRRSDMAEATSPDYKPILLATSCKGPWPSTDWICSAEIGKLVLFEIHDATTSPKPSGPIVPMGFWLAQIVGFCNWLAPLQACKAVFCRLCCGLPQALAP
jgi:hypothetical protein